MCFFGRDQVFVIIWCLLESFRENCINSTSNNDIQIQLLFFVLLFLTFNSKSKLRLQNIIYI